MEIEQNHNELVEWVASILTQYQIRDLWEMDFIQFFKVKDRAEHIQREKMRSLKRSRSSRK